MRRWLNFPISPVFLATYPILHIYSNNVGSVDPSIVAPPLVVAAAVALLLNAFFALCLKDWRKGAILVNIALYSTFLWTCIIDVVCPWIYGTPAGKYVAIGMMVLIGILIWRVGGVLTRSAHIFEFTWIANLIATLLLLVPLSTILFHHVINPAARLNENALQHVERPAPRPDVYYIILDGYGRDDVLKEEFGYDNSSFTNFLRRNGFFVARQSMSNYAYTYLSLASSLNMSYISELNQVPEQQAECIQRITNNNVARLFRSHGYQVIHFAPMWTGMNANTYSKNTFNPARVDEFQMLISKRFLLRPFMRESLTNVFKARTYYTLRHLEELTKNPRPKFVFAHLLCPHPPYVFDRQGNTPAPQVVKTIPPGSMDWAPKEQYVDQLSYLNQLVQGTITKILKESKTRPIIVIQGDHGPACDGTSDKPTPLMVRERMSILNAYLVPLPLRRKLYPSITPVNTFSIIAGMLFKLPFPQLPDESFYSGPIDSTPYEFKNIKTLR